MATPKGKISKARKHSRRSAHWKLAAQMKLSHRVCKQCGYYDGQQVITIEEKQANK